MTRRSQQLLTHHESDICGDMILNSFKSDRYPQFTGVPKAAEARLLVVLADIRSKVRNRDCPYVRRSLDRAEIAGGPGRVVSCGELRASVAGEFGVGGKIL